MKIKTSGTISEELLKLIDALGIRGQGRSVFLETAMWEYIARAHRARQNAREVGIMEQQVDYLNEELMDALEYQVPIP